MMRMIAILITLIGLLVAQSVHAEGVLTRPGQDHGIAWDAVLAADIKEYRVWISRTPGIYDFTAQPWAIILHPTTSATFTTSSPIPPEGQNYIIVTACDLAGNCSSPSNEVAFVYDSIAPMPPIIRFLFP